jgi:hypothetical protein
MEALVHVVTGHPLVVIAAAIIAVLSLNNFGPRRS